MTGDHVDTGVLVVMVVDALAPVLGGFPFQQGDKGHALHVIRNFDSRHLEEGPGIVEVLDEVLVAGARLCDTRPIHDERHL